MTNRKIILVGALTGFASLMICVWAGYQLLFNGCLPWQCASSRSVSVLELDLPADIFPPGATIGPLHHPSENTGAKESGIKSVFWKGGDGAAIYNVWRFLTNEQASRFYAALVSDVMELREIHPFVSTYAGESITRCGYSEFGGYVCDYTGRYQEFVLTFNVTIDDQMSLDEFEEAVAVVDEQIGEFLHATLSP